jgi:hypothetical protein
VKNLALPALDLARLAWLACLAASASLPCAACATGDGMRFQVIHMEQPSGDLGLPPPADYTPCYAGEARGYDTDGDGKTDKVKVSVNGRDRCYGEDTDHNGRIDTWDVVDESGHLAKRAHDSNGDGKVDQAWTFDPTRRGCATVAADVNADGKPDPGTPVDICQQLAGAPPGPTPPIPPSPTPASAPPKSGAAK